MSSAWLIRWMCMLGPEEYFLVSQGPHDDFIAKFCFLGSVGYSGSDIRLSFGSVLTLIVIWKVFFFLASALNMHIWNVSWNQGFFLFRILEGKSFKLIFYESLLMEVLFCSLLQDWQRDWLKWMFCLSKMLEFLISAWYGKVFLLYYF